MANFFDDKDVVTDQSNVGTVMPEVEKLKVGEEEYTQEELKHLVGLAKSTREAEERYNTRLDKVWPEYGRAQSKIKDLERELEEARKAREEKPLPANEEQAKMEARKAAKSLGILLDEDFEPNLEKKFRDFYVRERQAEKLLDEVKELETQYDGKDGRPVFRGETVLEHMQRTGIQNPEKAYKDMFEKELDNWKIKQLDAGRKRGMTSQIGGAQAKIPQDVRPTRENLDQLVAEMLNAEE